MPFESLVLSRRKRSDETNMAARGGAHMHALCVSIHNRVRACGAWFCVLVCMRACWRGQVRVALPRDGQDRDGERALRQGGQDHGHAHRLRHLRLQAGYDAMKIVIHYNNYNYCIMDRHHSCNDRRHSCADIWQPSACGAANGEWGRDRDCRWAGGDRRRSS